MPTIQTVELDGVVIRNLIQIATMMHTSTLQTFPRPRSKMLWFSCLNSLNTSKLRVFSCLTKPRMEMVGENDETESTTVDQPHSLEDLIILLSDDSSPASCVWRDGAWVLPCCAFIDLQELLRDVLDVVKRGSDWKTRSGNEGTRTL